MLIVYTSLTGNVRSFVEKVGMRSVEVSHSNLEFEVDDDYIFICPTYDNELNDFVSKFIDYKGNSKRLIGFAGSGNRNFDKSYCHNAKFLSYKYNKQLLFTFEFSGLDNDIIEFKKEVNGI